MSNTQKDILQIIRKEEDQAMSLLAASPLLSSLFLTYANRAATLDGSPTPSPIDKEWAEMKASNKSLQDEVESLRAQLHKETERAKAAEDCVDALRAQLSSVKNANCDLETALVDERVKLGEITTEYEEHKKEATRTIAELRVNMDKEAVSAAAIFRSRISFCSRAHEPP
jgi:chromosome segregation ATPase